MGHNQDDTCHMSKELSPLSTGLLTSYGRAVPRWWKKRVSWSRGKRCDHLDNHLWKKGKKKEGKVDVHFPCTSWSYFPLSLSSVPSYTVHLSKVSRTYYPFYITQAISNTSPLSWTPPKLVTVLHLVQTIHALVWMSALLPEWPWSWHI